MGLKAKIAAIEFADDEVRVALVKPGGKLPKVLDLQVCRVEYAGDEERFDALVQAVRTVFGRMKVRPSAYVLCISSLHTVVRTIHIPFRGKRRVAAAVRFELEPYLAFPIEELVVDFFPVLEIEGQTDVFAVGVRRTLIEEQLAVLKAAGIEAGGAGVDALGLTALWQASRRGAKGLSAALHVREEGAVLAITNNKKLVYFRHLPFVGPEFHENPARGIREVLNSLRGFLAVWRGGGEIASLAVTGMGLSDEERDLFEEDLGVSVVEEDPIARLECGDVVARADAGVSEIETAGGAKESEQTEEPPWFAPLDSTDDATGDAPSAVAPDAADDAPSEPEETVEPEWAPTSEMSDFTPSEDAEAGDPTATEPGESAEPDGSPEADPGDYTPEEADRSGGADRRADDDAGPAEASRPVPLPSEMSNCWEAAIGVAMGAAGASPFMDFLKEKRTWLITCRGMVGHVTFSSCLALLVLVIWAWHYHDGRAENLTEASRLRAQFEEVQAEVEGLQARGVDVPTETFSAPTLLEILEEIGSKMPDSKVSITELKIDRPDTLGPWIAVQGQVKDDAAFNEAFSELKKSTLFRVDDDPGLKLVGGTSTFKITARPNEAPSDVSEDEP